MNDFDQIMANANSNTTKSNKSFDKNVWRERKQQERQEVYDLMDKTADEIKTDINKYKQYLDVQGRFDKYSVGNALVISATYPNATQIKEFDDWKESGAFIKKGANGIKILEPGDSYTRSDGSSAISYNVKKMFDISQTTSTQKPRTINYDDRVKLTALLKDCPVDIKAVDEIPNSDKVALWSKEDNVLYVKRGGETPTIFKQLAKELTRSALEETGNTELDNFKCESTSYMLCKKYGIDVLDININTIPEAFEALLSIHEVLEMSVGYVYRRDFFIDKHFEFKEGLYHEDFGLIPLVLTQATRVASVNVGYYNYVQTSQSITRGGISKVRLCNDLLLHYDNMIDYLPSLTLSRKIKREIKMFYSNCIIFSLNNLEENERKRYIKEIKRRKILYNIKIQSIKEIKLKLILHCNLERYLKLERHILL